MRNQISVYRTPGPLRAWTWFCEVCGDAQTRVYSETDAREAATRHRVTSHSESLLPGGVEIPIVSRDVQDGWSSD